MFVNVLDDNNTLKMESSDDFVSTHLLPVFSKRH